MVTCMMWIDYTVRVLLWWTEALLPVLTLWSLGSLYQYKGEL